MNGNVLVVDDDREMGSYLEACLRPHGLEVTVCESAAEAVAALERKRLDLVLADLRLREGEDGLALCARISRDWSDVPTIVMTAFGDLDAAVGAIRSGAFDFLAKPFEVEALLIALERGLRHRALHREVHELRARLEDALPFSEIIGDSPPVRAMCDMVDRVAGSEAAVLVTGETGSGKELVARAIHRRSPRAAAELVAVNCAAIPAALLESELFGHARGAFTGAGVEREGLVRRARGGTLFLDEIGDMPLELQAKLLRALEEGAVRPVGSDRARPTDVRLIAATNADLERAVREERFRADLLYRIDVIRVPVPPLRDRGDDVLLLAQHFLDRAAVRAGKRVVGMAGAVADRLLRYGWPGNVRELANCMERAVTLTAHDHVVVEDLPPKVRGAGPAAGAVPPASGARSGELVTLVEMERRYVLAVLEATGGNKARAARILGLDRRTLYRKLEQWAARSQA